VNVTFKLYEYATNHTPGGEHRLYKDATPPAGAVKPASGVRASPAAAASFAVPATLACTPAERWPGGPPNRLDDTCCGPMALAAGTPLIQFASVPRI
jgi:hypothetical protein